MSTSDGLRSITAKEISDNYERILDLARQGRVFIRDDVNASLPDCLMSPEALRLWDRLKKAGLVSDDYHTIGLSYARKAILASIMARHLGIHDAWKVFSECWNCKKNTLRRAYYKALEQEKIYIFIEEIQQIFLISD